ncbi:MAG TPA: FG-GAP-like repeat-containing protein [Candidatus Acidoferrum sp.]|nr:FG-GAP-like repeat-containing protein [Candidatus Acidoferrum sp.]
MKMFGIRRILVALFVLLPLIISGGSALATIPNPVPHLNPIVPASAAPGGPAFTMTVTGTGFVSGSVVSWNGSPRTTTFVSSSNLTAAILATDIAHLGVATVTVASPAPGGGTSNSQFFSITTAQAQLSWTVKDVTGNSPLTTPVVSADLNNDGKLDLMAAVGPTIWVSLGNGDGTFLSGIPSSGPAGTITAINIADVNGDGKLDLIVTGSKDSTTSFVATMLGKGDGTFQAPVETDLAGAHIPQEVIAADLNGDGVLDLAYASGMSVQTLLGKGDGTFQEGPSTTLNQIPLKVVATGDFNKDGKADLVVTVYDLFSTGFDFVVVLPGNGDGGFGPPVNVAGSGSSFVGAITAAVGDFNGDGNLDIATGIQTAGATIQAFIQIAFGNGDGTFQAVTNVPNVSAVTTPLLVADLNGDGNLDLVTGGFGYFGRGDGTFPTSQGSTGTPTYVFVGDFNGDGFLDLVDETITLSGPTTMTSIGLTLQAPPAPDFRGIVAPFTAILVPGSSLQIKVNVQPLYGFTGDVIVGATNLPAGITPSYNPVLVKGGNGSTTITLSAASTVPLGNYSVTLTGNSGSITHTTTLPITVNSTVAGDWIGTVVQPTQNIAPGGTATYQFTTAPVNGVSSGDITPTVTGLPPGATASFSPALIVGEQGGTKLTVQTSNTTPQPQVYTLIVTGTNGDLVKSTPVYLGVSSAGGDFTGSVTPTQATTAAGGSVTYSLQAVPVNGGAGDIALSISGLPAGAIATFAPLVIPGSSGTGTLTVNTSTGTVPGSYTLVITSTASGVIHLQGVTLTVTP